MEFKVRTGDKDGRVVIDQIRTIDKQQVVKVSGKLTVNESSICQSTQKDNEFYIWLVLLNELFIACRIDRRSIKHG